MDINDILASLTPDDIEALKETADTVFGSGSPPPKNSGTNQKQNGFDFGRFDPEMFSKIGSIMSALNSDGGKKCRLIEALKPNLSPPRQKKADEAMQIMKLLDILPVIKELTNRDD